jgi:hypothetical protein
MRSLFAIVCVGAIFVAALFPGVVALYAALIRLGDLTVGFDGSKPRPVVRQPFVSPALIALAVSHHLPRASLLPARS